MSKSAYTKYVVSGGLLLAGLYMAKSSIFYVGKNENALLFDRFNGVLPTIYEHGFHFKRPNQSPIIFNMNPNPEAISIPAVTNDSLAIYVNLKISFRPVKEDLRSLFNNIGPDYAKIILPCLSNEVTKEVVLKYKREELDNYKVFQEIKDQLITRARQFSVMIEEVIGEIHFV